MRPRSPTEDVVELCRLVEASTMQEAPGTRGAAARSGGSCPTRLRSSVIIVRNSEREHSARSTCAAAWPVDHGVPIVARSCPPATAQEHRRERHHARRRTARSTATFTALRQPDCFMPPALRAGTTLSGGGSGTSRRWRGARHRGPGAGLPVAVRLALRTVGLRRRHRARLEPGTSPMKRLRTRASPLPRSTLPLGGPRACRSPGPTS